MNRLFCCFVFVLLLPGLSAQTKASNPPTTSKMFAPYVDMGKISTDLRSLMKQSGIKRFTLAFVQSQGCTPSWYGAGAAVEENFKKQIKQLRSAGGDVILAFGGYEGTDLAQACTDVPSLQAAYQAVINKYKVRILDFDVEHLAIEDQASIDRRSQALKALAAANPKLQINYTLPSTPQGLTPQSMNVMKSAAQFRVPVAIVNLMTMDYGVSAPNKDMGANAIAAATAACEQLKFLGVNARLGITPMIGMNDVAGETFTLADAQAVLDYAHSNGDKVSLLSFWSLGRDNGNCPGTVSPNCSGIKQSDWEFSKLFGKFR